MPTNILSDLLIIFGVSSLVVVLFHWVRQPPIAGFLISGMLLGPYGLGWIENLERVRSLSEIGIVLLLFSLGIEFSLPSLLRNRQAFFGLGAIQCFITTLATMAVLRILGFGMAPSFILGSMVSLSSTAIVLKLLHQKREITSPHGNLSVAVLLFQDLWVIPLMILLPLLSAGSTLSHNARVSMVVGKFIESALWIVLVVVCTKYLVPFLLRLSALTRIRELFLITVAFIALGCSWFMGSVGLSMALGAFIGGMMISGSDYGHQAVSETVPFREPFLALFFVSIGMLLDLKFVMEHAPFILVLGLLTIAIKFVIVATAASILGVGSRVAALTAIVLSQIGEFSFVLADKASEEKLITHTDYQYFLSVTLVLMFLTPLLFQLAPKLASKLSEYDFLGKIVAKKEQLYDSSELKDHILIIGYGVIGKDLAKHLLVESIPHSIIELNLQSVRTAKAEGVPIHYGDASRREVLEAAGIHNAKVVVIVINDSKLIPQIVHTVRALRPSVPMLVRVNFLLDAKEMHLPEPVEYVIAETEVSHRIRDRALSIFQPLET